ncbi:MAG TPA: hypothetical protein VF623_01520 [Segetibacter sp.]|jgi:hypothetical protein
MKKFLTVSLSTIVISLTIASNVSAQPDKEVAVSNIKNNAAMNFYKNESSADKNIAGTTKERIKEAKKELKALKANTRATAHFQKSFIDVPEAIWSVEKNVIVAAFTKNEVRTTAIYDKKGYLIHTLTYYQEPQTPNNIRSVIERDYPDGNINLTIQVRENGMEFYIVQIEDKRTYKELAVYNGVTGIIKQFNKNR